MTNRALGVGRTVEHAVRTVVIVDVVESVRLVEQDEDGVVGQWLGFVDHVETNILPSYAGHLVKGLGDGMLLEFNEVQLAMSAAFAIQHAINQENLDLPPDRQFLLRMGVEVSNIIVDKDDLYGRGVNLATRLAMLAGPNEIVVSSNTRAQLTPVLDADIEDLGECFLKHIKDPVRAYRVGPPGPHPVIAPASPLGDLLPSLAIVPFANWDGERDHHLLGEILAEEMIRALSHSHDLSVISRLSTTALRGRDMTLEQISSYLSANYVLSGVYRVVDQHLTLDVELSEAKSGQIVWMERLEEQIPAAITEDGELISHIIAKVGMEIVSREVQRAQMQSPPTLKSYTLLLGAIGLMHRLSVQDFDEAHHLLQTLVDRSPRQSIPLAWLAKWHVLRVQQGWSPDPHRDAQHALQCSKRAIENDPRCSLALTIDGIVHTNLLKQLDIAQDRYELAIQINPSESLAWLLKGTLHAFKGEGAQAVDDTQRALMLSPLDPHRYFYDSLAATACLAARQFDRAAIFARRSMRANRTHTSTFRALAVAQWQLGQPEKAHATTRELLELEPSLTISSWLERSPAALYPIGREWAEVFRQLGVPA